MTDRIYTADELKARFSLIYWQTQTPNNFSSILYYLITKADLKNKYKLKIAFPIEFEAFQEWQNSDDEKKLFERWQSAK